jgi:hypothetical protein
LRLYSTEALIAARFLLVELEAEQQE